VTRRTDERPFAWHSGSTIPVHPVLRDINPNDKPALQRLHLRLSAETRYRRFHGAKGRLTLGDLRYMTEVDGTDHIAIVADEGGSGELLGVARAVRDGEEAEIAIVVRDDQQGTGLGRDLVEELLRRLRRRPGLRRAVAQVQSDNHRAIAFFQTLGARQRGTTGITLDLVFDVDAQAGRTDRAA
jgi:RimJ/RimL family protein N-acetyltransferase